jgi:acyl transferase domain-containing protein/acyl carrier protein
MKTASEISAWLCSELAQRLALPPNGIDRNERFSRYGLDSFRAIVLLRDLSQWLGAAVSSTAPWDHPTVASLSRHLAGDRTPEPKTVERASVSEPIAVVGMACRFPGGAFSPDAFWHLLSEGRDAITAAPASRWRDGANRLPPAIHELLLAMRGGFLESIDRFDAAFFGISPREAAQMDPQQRLMLELSWEALEDAGISPLGLRDTDTGVWIGAIWNDYAALQHRRGPDAITQHTATGSHYSIIANRVSYQLGLRGPSMVIDTACSSSLVAVHVACQSILAGECELAIAGGVNLIAAPDSMIAMSKFGAMARDGRCKTFDARADGYVRGEGGGLVALKPLSAAIRDADRIYCLIRGSAVNNDGWSNGLTAPSSEAQEQVIRAALARAGVEPSEVHFVEAHGTGTLLGDPIEAGALGRVLGSGRALDQPLSIGSVKTNLGHLEGAAGIAGLLKTALALYHREIPPNLHFETPNPRIDFDELRLQVPTVRTPWPSGTARAGVSSFGFGGTNSHVVLEALPAGDRELEQLEIGSPGTRGADGRIAFVFPGQGSQWIGMGRELFRFEPVFRARLEQCSDAIQGCTGESILDCLMATADGARARFAEVGIVQPAIFSVQLALAAWWRSRGIEPSVVVGHSMGEVAAACVAEILTLEDAARVICMRSQLVQRHASGKGSMAHVALSEQEAAVAIEKLEGRVVVAAVNGPRTVLLSGERAGLTDLVATLVQQGVHAQLVNVDYASHGPQVDSFAVELREALQSIAPRAARIPMWSTLLEREVGGLELDASYWVRNLREPVRFASGIGSLSRDGVRDFLELSPHPILTKAIEQCLEDRAPLARAVPTLVRGEPEQRALLDAARALIARGHSVRRDRSVRLIPISARSRRSLVEHAGRLHRWLDGSNLSIDDLAYTTSCRRAHHPVREALVVRSREECMEKLARLAGSDAGTGAALSEPKVAFVFAGQGSQWTGMGRALFAAAPAFRARLLDADRAISRHAGWSVIDRLFADAALLDDVIQPTLFAVQVAFAALFRAWGIEPSIVVGHSMGEIAAACVAGALDLDSAAQLIVQRSRILRNHAGARGAMVAVDLSLEEARAAIAGLEDRLAVAVHNGPRSCVLSGDAEAMRRVTERLEAADVFCRRVKVEFASHSPLIAELEPRLASELGWIRPRASEIPLLSTVTGRLSHGLDLDTSYWVRNVSQMVRFHDAVLDLHAAGHDVFLEIGPHPVLSSAIREGLPPDAAFEVLCPSRRDDDEVISAFATLGRLYSLGCEPSWKAVVPQGGRLVSMPGYAWASDRHWLEEPTRSDAAREREDAGPLLRAGVHVLDSTSLARHLWDVELGADRLPYLADHRIRERIILPASAYVELAFEAAAEVIGEGPVAVVGLQLHDALVLPAAGHARAQIIVASEAPGSFGFRVKSEGEHAAAHLRLLKPRPDEPIDLGMIRARCREEVSSADHHRLLAATGIEHGPLFQKIRRMWIGDAEAVVEIDASRADDHRLHPAVLDAGFQAVLALACRAVKDATFVPSSIREVRLLRPIASQVLWAHAVLRTVGEATASGDVVLLDPDGRPIAEVTGMHLQRIASASAGEVMRRQGWFHQLAWKRCSLRADPEASLRHFVLVTDRGGVLRAVGDALRAAGHRVLELAEHEDASRLVSSAWSAGPAVIVYGRSLDLAQAEGAPDTRHLSDLLAIVRAAAASSTPASLAIITRNAHEVGASDALSPPAASLWGFLRVVDHEHPELRATRIDLSGSEHEVDQLSAELAAGSSGDEIALRDGERWVASIVEGIAARTKATAPRAIPGSCYRAEIPEPGLIDNLRLRAAPAPEAARGQVAIDVRCAGLNFLNVLSALGQYPGGEAPLGVECSGTIVEVGPDVFGFAVGDPVIAFGYHGLGNRIVADARLTFSKPSSLGWDEAASLPIVFLTAYHGLVQLARVQPGDKVLVHAAAGGVGLAAIQICRMIGAEVFATTGTQAKQDHLHRLGIERVMSSRTLEFVDQIAEATAGTGVDVVLNSLGSEFIQASLDCLAPYGRFVEIGKRDIYANRTLGLLPFSRCLSYFAVDLDRQARDRPDVVAALWRETWSKFEHGALAPLPIERFPISAMKDAFRHMARAEHVGKVVLSFDETVVPLDDVPAVRPTIRRDATYLVTGGQGGLGFEVARWLAAQGAGQLVLASRRGEASAQHVAELERSGTRVAIVKADVSRAEDVTTLVQEIGRTKPPLRGVFHLAAVLEDATIANLTDDSLARVMGAKAHGAWNLHVATAPCKLDMFVLFSSIASLVGTPGQANYAAANAYLDALSEHRHGLGLPALSIQWGPWSEVGLAVEAQRGARLAERGIGSLSPKDGIEILSALLGTEVAVVAAGPFDMRRWCEAHPQLTARALYSRARTLEPLDREKAGEQWQTILPAELLARLELQVRTHLARVLAMAVEQVERDRPFRTMGLDSLMMVELRNVLGASVGVALTATDVFNYPTVAKLASRIAARLRPEPEPAPGTDPEDDPALRLLRELARTPDSALDPT